MRLQDSLFSPRLVANTGYTASSQRAGTRRAVCQPRALPEPGRQGFPHPTLLTCPKLSAGGVLRQAFAWPWNCLFHSMSKSPGLRKGIGNRDNLHPKGQPTHNRELPGLQQLSSHLKKWRDVLVHLILSPVLQIPLGSKNLGKRGFSSGKNEAQRKGYVCGLLGVVLLLFFCFVFGFVFVLFFFSLRQDLVIHFTKPRLAQSL